MAVVITEVIGQRRFAAAAAAAASRSFARLFLSLLAGVTSVESAFTGVGELCGSSANKGARDAFTEAFKTVVLLLLCNSMSQQQQQRRKTEQD